jgi:hypothetical protein
MWSEMGNFLVSLLKCSIAVDLLSPLTLPVSGGG